MNEYNEILKKYRKSLAKEGFIQSLIWGCIIGFSAMTVLAVLFYCIGTPMIWLAPVIGTALVIAGTAVLYFAKFRPTLKQVAERTDMLGLKERVITMVETMGDTSYMAVRQREDTVVQLRKFSNRKLKLEIMIVPLIIACLLALLGVAGTAVAAMSVNGTVPGIDALLPDSSEETSLVEVMYMEEDGGHIEGAPVQIVSKGGDCTEVVAVADDGNVFDIWSDGVTTPERTDKNVVQSMTVFALFVELDDDAAGGEMEDSMDMGSGSIDADGQMPEGGGAGGKYEEYNQVIDGETYYRDVYQEYYEQAMRILSEGGVVPEYIRIIIQNYFDAIQ